MPVANDQLASLNAAFWLVVHDFLLIKLGRLSYDFEVYPDADAQNNEEVGQAQILDDFYSIFSARRNHTTIFALYREELASGDQRCKEE